MAHRARIIGGTLVAALLALTACGPVVIDEPPPTPTPRPTIAPSPTPMPLSSGAGQSAPVGTAGSSGALAGAPVPAPLSFVDVVKRVQAAVVTVVNEQQVRGIDQPLETGSGTGFIIDDQGHIVTNQHVVEGGDTFEVILADGTKRSATLVGADPLSDLAVVKIDGGVPATVTFGDSDALQVGQPVLAIGSPLGQFTGTATSGIISALNRDFPGAAEVGETAYSNLIQHDAPINPGNSGGPLFDLTGQVIGVNTLGIPESQGVPAQGLFFAIPSNTVQRITSQLIQDGHVRYPYFGGSFQEITPAVASQYELPVDYGAYVVRVEPNGPAAQAGIRRDDIIVAIGDQKLDAQTSFTEALFAHQPGDTVSVTVQRGDQQVQLQVTLGERPPQ